MQAKLQPNDAATIQRARTEHASYLGPTVLGVSATLVSATIFAAVFFSGCRLGIGCAVPNPNGESTRSAVRLITTSAVPIAALTEAAALVAMAVDRARGRERYFTHTALAGMLLGTAAFLAAAAQLFADRRLLVDPVLVARSRRGVILIGHGAWAATLAYLTGSPTDYVMVQLESHELETPIVSCVDEKTPLRAVVVPDPTSRV